METWDLGNEDMGRKNVGTPGRGTYRLQDTINKQHLSFFAEFVECSRERYYMLKVISQLAWHARQWKTAMKMASICGITICFNHISLIRYGCKTAVFHILPDFWKGVHNKHSSGLTSSFNSPGALIFTFITNLLLDRWIESTVRHFTCGIKGPSSAITGVMGYGPYWQPCGSFAQFR